MSRRVLDEQFWLRDFAVTDGDVSRLYVHLRQSGRPERAMDLLVQVVRHKLEQVPQELDDLQRRKSEAAAQKLLQDQRARVYRQTDDYKVGDRVLVAWSTTKSQWECDVGVVVEKKPSDAPHFRWMIYVQCNDGRKHRYATGADLTHPYAKNWTPPFDVQVSGLSPEQVVDQILHAYGAVLISHLWGRLRQDARFVCWGDSCWLAEALPPLPQNVLDRAAAYLWIQDAPAATDHLLEVLGLPADEPHRWALNLALTADGRFENAGTETEPRWKAPLPDHLIRLADGKFLDLSAPPDRLWADHYEIFHGPLPLELADHPRVLSFGGRWLLDVLLIPLSDDDLLRVREFLVAQGQAVAAEDILREIFGITPQHDAFERWRFTLGYRLQQMGKKLGVEFVGIGPTWRWAMEAAPVERPERHRRLRGTERLPITYTPPEQIVRTLTADDEPLDVPEEEPAAEEWRPTRQTWEYVLTYYDWANGVLPYNRQAREVIPPLREGQRRAVLLFLAEQVDDRPFEVTLYADPRTPWLSSQGLKDFFAGYLVPGARIWVDRTEDPGLYKIRYRPTAPQRRRLLFFEEERIRPVIREVEIACEVDESMLLAEGRYADVAALRRLDEIDRRTAPRVLATIFEVIGEKDEALGIYRARFDDVFPLLCITKPYSRAYVQQILYDRKNYPWFYHDSERGGDWFVYDPRQTAVPVARPVSMPSPRPARPPKQMEGIRGEVAKWIGRELATLDQQHPFRILEVTNTGVRIRMERTGQSRIILWSEIEGAWRHLLSQRELSRQEIQRHYSEFNPAYVAAILASLPGVRHQTDPIRLFYEPPGAPTGVPLAGPYAPAPEPPEEVPAPFAGPPEVFPEYQEIAMPPLETVPIPEAPSAQPEQLEAAEIPPVETPLPAEVPPIPPEQPGAAEVPSAEAPPPAEVPPIPPEVAVTPPAAEIAPLQAPHPAHPRDRKLQEAIAAAAIAEPAPPPEPPPVRPEPPEGIAPPSAEPTPPVQPEEVRHFFIPFVRWLRRLWSRLRRARLNP